MRILYITGSLGAISQTFVTDLITELGERDDVTVMCDSVRKRPKNTKVLIASSSHYPARVLVKLASLFDKIRPSSSSALYAVRNMLTYRQIRRLQIDVAYIDFGTRAVNVHRALYSMGVPYVVHFHGYDASMAIGATRYRRELARIFREAHAIVVPSDHVRRLLVLEGCHPSKIATVRHGISTEDNRPQMSRSRQDSDGFRLVFLGRFTPKKRVDALIYMLQRVLEHVPNVQLELIGDGEEWGRVSSAIRLCEIGKHVQMHGSLPRSKALEIVARCDVYVQHSVTPHTGDQEGWALSLSEAALLELPIVATIHNGIPENVIDGKTGYLVPEYNFEMMADRVIELLRDPVKRTQFGRNGRQRFVESEEYTTTYRSNRIHDILLGSLGAENSASASKR